MWIITRGLGSETIITRGYGKSIAGHFISGLLKLTAQTKQIIIKAVMENPAIQATIKKLITTTKIKTPETAPTAKTPVITPQIK